MQFTSILVIRITGALTIAMGIAVLAGWALDVQGLKSVFPRLNTMKPNTAAGFMLSGVSLSMLATTPGGKIAKWLSHIAAWLVILFGMLTFAQYIFDTNLGIDNLLFQVPPGASYSDQNPARMTPQAALIFSIFNGCILLIWRQKSLAFTQYLALATTLVPLLTMLGYLFGIHALPWLGAYKPTALHTTVGFLILSAGILAASSNVGIFATPRYEPPKIAFGLALLLLLLSVTASIINARHTDASNVSHIKMYEILWRLEQVATEIEQSIAANRGFAITGQEHLIAAIKPSRDRMQALLAQIHQRVDDSDQLKKLSAMESLIADRNRIVDEIIRLRKDKGLQETIAVLMQGEGDRINRQIRTQMDAFIQAENNRLAQVETQTQAEKNNALLALSLTLITGLCLIGFGLLALKIQTLNRKLAEAERNRLVAILEASTDLVSTADLQANITYINRAGRTMLKLGGRPVTELKIPDVHPPWAMAIISEQGIPSAIQDGSWQGETALITTEGCEIPVSQIILSHRDEHNRISYLSTVMRDISARKNAENALRIRDNALKTSLNAIAMADLAGNLTYVNDSFLSLWGYTEATDILGKPASTLWQASTRAQEIMTGMVNTGQSWRGGLTGLKKNGELFEVDIAGNIAYDEDGKPIALIASFLDISERCRLEELQRQILQRLDTLANASPALLWTSDLDKNCDWFNRCWLEFTGRTIEQEKGSGWTEGVHPDDRAHCLSTYSSAFDARQPFAMQYRLRRHDGEYRWLFDQGLPRYDANGEFIGYIGSCMDITEEKHTRDELNVSERRLRLALRAAHQGMYDLDLVSGAAIVSPEYPLMLGYDPDNFSETYTTWLERLHPDDRERVEQTYRSYLGGEIQEYKAEFRLRMRSGQWKWILSQGSVVEYAADGQPLRMLGTHTDIDMRKLAEQQLTEREAFYRGVIEASPDSFWLIDTHGRILQASESYCQRSGFSQNELLSMSIMDLDANMATPEISDRIQHLLREKHTVFETRHRAKDGSTWPVEISAVFLPVAGGRFFSFIRDISERKQAENQLRASETSLKEAQRLAQIGSWELDLVNNKLNWSEEIFRIFEIDPTQFGASYEAFLEVIHPEDRALVNTAYLDSVKNHGSYSIIHRLLTADGRIKYVHERGETFYFQEQAVRSIGTVQDITQAKLAEQELLLYRNHLETLVTKRTAELEAVNQELEAFAYSVSHDLRAPLRGIDGFSQALLEDYGDKLDDTGRNYLARVRGASQRMGILIDDLLKLSRITRAVLKHAPVDLSNLANMVLNQLREIDPAHVVETWVEPGLTVNGDPGLLKIALENLLGNAWKYSAKTPSPHIAFGSAPQDGETVFYISDNGAGFDMQYADKLFRPFQRLHHRDQFEGTGIGLATAKRIIHRHGGRIWAESEVDKKTTFYFTLSREELPNENQ